MKANFRQMISLDIPLLVSMEREIYPESPWSANQFKEELAGMPKTREYLVALDEIEVIGYGGVALLGDVADIHTLTIKIGLNDDEFAPIRTNGDVQEESYTDDKAQ